MYRASKKKPDEESKFRRNKRYFSVLLIPPFLNSAILMITGQRCIT